MRINRRLKKTYPMITAVSSLIVVGLLTVVISNSVLAWFFYHLGKDRSSFLSFRQSNLEFANSVYQITANTKEAFDKNLSLTKLGGDLPPPTLDVEWEDSLRELSRRERLSVRTSSPWLPLLTAVTGKIISLADETKSWRSSYLPLVRDLVSHESVDNVSRILRNSHDLLAISLAKARLEQVVSINNMPSSEEDKVRWLDNFRENNQRARAILEIMRDLNALISNIEILSYLQNEDELRNERDNKLAPLLRRITASLNSLSIRQPQLGSEVSQGFHSALTELLGAEFKLSVSPPSLAEGKDGLFSKISALISKREERLILLRTIDGQINLLNKVQNEIAQEANTQAVRVLEEINTKLEHAWKLIVMIGVISLILYLIAAHFSYDTALTHVSRSANREHALSAINAQLKLSHEGIERAVSYAEAVERSASEILSSQGDYSVSVNRHLRTPMCGVLGMSEILLSGNLSKEQHSQISAISRSVSNMVRMLNNATDCALIDAHRLDVERVDFSLTKILSDVVCSVESRIEQGLVRIMLNIRDGVPSQLIGDPTRIGQIVDALLHHASRSRKANGSVVLRVSTVSESPRHTTIQFSLVDSDSQSSWHNYPPLNDLFVHGEAAKIKDHGAFGISLLLAGKLVRLMGGRAWSEQMEDKGIVVHFNLRLQISRISAESNCLETDSNFDQSQETTPSIGSNTRFCRLMLVEDNEIYAQAATRLLTNSGYEITVAPSGREALKILTQQPIDMLLFCLETPQTDAFETVRSIRQSELNSHSYLTIIGLTSSANKEERDKCFSSGMDDYVTRPVSALGFVAIIERNNKRTALS